MGSYMASRSVFLINTWTVNPHLMGTNHGLWALLKWMVEIQMLYICPSKSWEYQRPSLCKRSTLRICEKMGKHPISAFFGISPRNLSWRHELYKFTCFSDYCHFSHVFVMGNRHPVEKNIWSSKDSELIKKTNPNMCNWKSSRIHVI